MTSAIAVAITTANASTVGVRRLVAIPPAAGDGWGAKAGMAGPPGPAAAEGAGAGAGAGDPGAGPRAATVSVAEAGTGASSSWDVPSWTTSPGVSRTLVSMRAPFTQVPFRDPRSSTSTVS